MDNKLSTPTIVLHWLTGLLFIGVLAFGLYVEELPKGDEKLEMLTLHKSFGITVLCFAFARLLWRLKEGEITHVAELSKVQELTAKSVHMVLLIGTLLMPISGLMMSIGGGHGAALFGFELYPESEKIEWMGSLGHDIHGPAAWLLLVTLLVHIAAAIKHHFIDKDKTLSRMLGRGSD
ncbi:cytochrome b [Pseudoalteromonas sp. T1lg10]|uniref:cytochrome b n=1 Tax=Pseudoalteromonas sp. T1lg10 TaxID=2077093 RepID=UPI000CF709F6|nr:cytochrome b [Pseudoalteromonas sp. T1lg10]